MNPPRMVFNRYSYGFVDFSMNSTQKNVEITVEADVPASTVFSYTQRLVNEA